MAPPATRWTGSVVVNGLMAIVLLVWLADISTRSPVPRQPTRTAAPDPSAKPSGRPIENPTSVDLPPPPRPTPEVSRDDVPAPADIRPVVPMRPSINRGSRQPIKIVALRAEKVKPRQTNPPVLAPLRPLEAPESASDPGIPTTGTKAEAHVTVEVEAMADAEVVVNVKAVRTGRQLLRILEHGEGPAIEIAWPGSTAQRERLHGVLQRCYGMRLALIDRAGGLYLDAGPRGNRWPIDLDRYSGFVRRPNGHITSAERRDADRVARYHHGLPATDPVRLFPRAADAALLGGLAHLLGGDYRAAKSITASYRLRGLRVTVGDLRIDGRRVAGRIDLSRGATAACRGTGHS